ncbi:MAG TPA: glycosyltransferase family 4 protein [Chitinivibrionales bacterium]|nr:glycosyltransferase family 4 protein [Chitinivibrionales bacterium]
MPEIGTKKNVGDGTLSRTRICFFSSVASFDTGMPICTHALIMRYLKDPGYEVHAVVPEPGEFADRLSAAGVPVSIVPFSRARSARRGAAFFRFSLGLPAALWRLYRFMKGKRFALVHFSDIIDAPFYPCAALSGARVVAHVRRAVETFAGRAAFRLWSALFADAAVCISRAVLRKSGLPAGRAAVVYDPGPDPLLFDATRSYRRLASIAAGRPAVVTIGKFLRVKGHEHFIRMAAACEKAAPGRMQYIIVGGREPGHERYFEAMEKLMKALGVDKSITVVGQVRHEEIPAILSHAAVLAHLPNYQEGLGGVLLEAMAMAVPVVAFDCGGVGECFVNGEHGFLVKQYDVAGAADRVMRLACDDGLGKRLGAAARAHVAEAFSPSRHFAAIDAVYRSLLSRT